MTKLKIGDEVNIHGYIDEIRKDVVIIRNEGGYFGTVQSEIKALEQPTSDDCVSRQAVDELCFRFLKPNSDENFAFYEHFRYLPPVTPTQRWIPCSERLPEDRNLVLVTAYWHETYQVMMASYFGDGLWWCVPFNNCGDHMQKLNPKAWQPLPRPYEEKRGSENE